jgi:hypothetical protein
MIGNPQPLHAIDGRDPSGGKGSGSASCRRVRHWWFMPELGPDAIEWRLTAVQRTLVVVVVE